MIIIKQQIIELLPILIIGTTIIFIMLSIAFRRGQFKHFLMTIAGLSASIVSLSIIWRSGNRNATQLICVDDFAIFYIVLILISSLASSIFVYSWLSYNKNNNDEYYLLLLISVIGGILLASTNNLITTFLGIELMSIPLYALISYSAFQRYSLEASIKYIMLSGISSSFLLFGIALIYIHTGHLSFVDIAAVFKSKNDIILLKPIWLLIIGFSMMMVGFGFKLSFVPFHLWTPDVYQGSPSAVSMYLTTSVKIAVISALTRFLLILPDQYNKILNMFLLSSACCSMLFGSLMGIQQNNIKRMLAYSSITHMGYLLVILIALYVNHFVHQETIGIYFISYLVANVGAFGMISIMSASYIKKDIDNIFFYRGLFWSKPILSILFTIIILSLAGIPTTLGFIGKFYLLMAGVNSGLWWSTFFIIISSVISMFYYLKILINLYLSPVNISYFNYNFLSNWATTPGGILVIVIAFILLILGLYPKPIIYFINFILYYHDNRVF